jgi:ubiquinone/menaquinone biosynthesis C-methylase UbiE
VGSSLRNILHGSRLFSHSPARELANDPFTQRARAIWIAGDYDRVSRGFQHEGEAFVERLGLTPSDNVLDAACGTGNLAVPAARTGARVTALDLIPTLLESTSNRAYREGLDITLDEGTVERMPYDKAEFDVVMSMFGVMFAARTDRVMAELKRVTRPGGRVALANWTRDGFVGKMLALHTAYLPPPADLPSPLLWGDEAAIYKRFDDDSWNVKTRLRTLTFRYPYTPGGTAKLFRTSYGPTVRAFEVLDNERRGQLAADLIDHWTEHQRPGKRITEVDSQYLEVIAIRR